MSKNRLGNILKCKCPKCHSGHMFIEKNPYKLKSIFKMFEKCEHCGQSFAPEPRFYEGSMYISYVFSVAIVVSVFVAFNVLTKDQPLIPMILTTVIMAFGFAPFSFRLSRSVWIHIFYRFDKSKV